MPGYVRMCAKAVQGESNTANNCSPAIRVGVVLGGGLDLRLGEPANRLVIARRAGNSTELTSTIQNVGEEESPPTLADGKLDSDGNPGIQTTDNAISDSNNRIRVPALAPLAEFEVKHTYRVPATASAGHTYDIGVCVDDVTGEINPGNNCSSGDAIARITVVSVSTDETAAAEAPPRESGGPARRPAVRDAPESRNRQLPDSFQVVIKAVKVPNPKTR